MIVRHLGVLAAVSEIVDRQIPGTIVGNDSRFTFVGQIKIHALFQLGVLEDCFAVLVVRPLQVSVTVLAASESTTMG